ncbi:MAG: hypothetical protein ABI886_16520 [Betaproteobacteria bacterium]
MKTRSTLSIALLTLATGSSASALAGDDTPATMQPDRIAAAAAAAAPAATVVATPVAKHSHLLEKVGTAPTRSNAPNAAPARDVHRHWRDAK